MKTENEMFELLTRHDSEAVDHMRAAIDMLKTYTDLAHAVELIASLWDEK